MINRIAVIFDFDETLAPDSTSSFLAEMGVDVEGSSISCYGVRSRILIHLC